MVSFAPPSKLLWIIGGRNEFHDVILILEYVIPHFNFVTISTLHLKDTEEGWNILRIRRRLSNDYYGLVIETAGSSDQS